MNNIQPERDPTQLDIDPGTRPFSEEYPLGFEPITKHIEEVSVKDGYRVEHLRAGASLRVELDCEPLADKDDVMAKLGIDGELVAYLRAGKNTNYMIVRFSEAFDGADSPFPTEDHSRYVVLGERAQVWLNLHTGGLASERTRDAMLQDLAVLSVGEGCQIGRTRSEESIGLKMISPAVDDPTVSKKHARLVCRDDGSLEVYDMYAINGTEVIRRQEY